MVDVDTSYEYHYVILILYFPKDQASNVAQIHLGLFFFILCFPEEDAIVFRRVYSAIWSQGVEVIMHHLSLHLLEFFFHGEEN